jgi:hypothetical protein
MPIISEKVIVHEQRAEREFSNLHLFVDPERRESYNLKFYEQFLFIIMVELCVKIKDETKTEVYIFGCNCKTMSAAQTEIEEYLRFDNDIPKYSSMKTRIYMRN